MIGREIIDSMVQKRDENNQAIHRKASWGGNLKAPFGSMQDDKPFSMEDLAKLAQEDNEEEEEYMNIVEGKKQVQV